MLKRIVIVLFALSTLCSAIALPAMAQVADEYRLVRKAERLADAAKSDDDRKKAEQQFQAALRKFSELNHERVKPML